MILVVCCKVFWAKLVSPPPNDFGLLRPCLGPFLVLHVIEKYYVIDIKGRADSVTIDRLKPAYMLRELNDFENNIKYDSEPVNNTDTVSK